MADQPEAIWQALSDEVVSENYQRVTSFACGFAPAQLVEEVFEEDLVGFRLLAFRCLGRHERDDALAVLRDI